MHTYKFPRPAVTVDIIVFRNSMSEVLLIKRLHPPFEGKWALPGGFMDMDETLEEAAVRELEEETGLKGIVLSQLHAFSALDRDPRHRTVSVAFYGVLENDRASVKAGSDAKEAEWFKLNTLPPLAFDHEEILEIAFRKLL
ncbi:MAG: NUDIX hydrolase [Bacteroidales bacterium]|nr:NUDIX hydrolase [Bacteroidales bacterium]